MIHLKIGDNSDLWVFVEEHGTWKQLPGHLVARSRLLQGLMRDFDGPQCSTTLPVSIQAFLLWSFGKLGCLEQAADLLNVADFLKDIELPALMHAIAQQLLDTMSSDNTQACPDMPPAAVQCLQSLPASLQLPVLRQLPLHTILSGAPASVHNSGVLAHVDQASRSLWLQAPNSIPLHCKTSPKKLFAGLPSLDTVNISFEEPENSVLVATVYDRWVAGWMPPFFQWLQGLNRLRSLSLTHLQLPPAQFSALTKSLLHVTALTHIGLEHSSVFPKTLRMHTRSNSSSSSDLLAIGSHSAHLGTSEDLTRRPRTSDSGVIGNSSGIPRHQRSLSSTSGELSTPRRRWNSYVASRNTHSAQLRALPKRTQAPSLSKLPKLRSLSLAHTDFHLLGYRSAKEFGADLSSMRSLKVLDLAGSLNTNEAVHIVSALRSSKVLESLNIADAPLSGSAASAKLRGYLTELPACLRSLNLSQPSPPSRQRSGSRTDGASMEFHPNDVIGAGMHAAVPQMLDVNPNGVVPATQGAFTMAWPTTLTTLTISGRSCVLMQAKDLSAEALLGSCRTLQNLRKLELSSPAVMGPARLGTVTAALLSMQHLEHLHLGPSQGTDESDNVTDRLATAVAGLTALTTLRMELCWLTADQLGVAVAPLKRLKRLGLSNVRPRDLAPVRGGSIWQPPPAVALVDALRTSAAPLTHIELDDYRPFARVIYKDVRACSLSSVLLDTSTLQSITLRDCSMDGDALAVIAGGVASGATPMLRRLRLHAAGPVALLPFLFFVYVLEFDERVEVHEWDIGPSRSIVTLCGSSAKVAQVELTDLMLRCNALVNN